MCANNVCSVLLAIAALFAFPPPSAAQHPFDREQAARTIADSKGFKDCHSGIDNRDACNWTIYTGTWERVAPYWHAAADQPQPDSLKANPIGYWLYTEKGYLQFSGSPVMLALSDKGRIAAKEWIHVTEPGREADTAPSPFERWDVPLATKKFLAVTSVVRGARMGGQFAEVRYVWGYALTPVGAELFKNKVIPSTGKNVGGWIAPAELTGIDLHKAFESSATFILHPEGWRLQENCSGDMC